MQAIKDKLSDMSTMRKAKAEAKEEEKAEKELAKARVEVAHEVRLAREAEAAMDMHVNKAAEKVARHETKQDSTGDNITSHAMHAAGDHHANDHPYVCGDASSLQPAYGGGNTDYSGSNASNTTSNMTNYSAGAGYTGAR